MTVFYSIPETLEELHSEQLLPPEHQLVANPWRRELLRQPACHPHCAVYIHRSQDTGGTAQHVPQTSSPAGHRRWVSVSAACAVWPLPLIGLLSGRERAIPAQGAVVVIENQNCPELNTVAENKNICNALVNIHPVNILCVACASSWLQMSFE